MDDEKTREKTPLGIRRTRTRILSAVILGAVFLFLQVFSWPESYDFEARSTDLRETEWPDWTLYAQGEIVWAPCPRMDDLDIPPGVDCGSVIVPKDYFNPSVGSSSVAFARMNATVPSKGAVFLNPGGPGGAGMSMILGARGLGRMLGDMIGHDWDLIGFDPRGIGMTRPATECFASPLDALLFNANTVVEQGITVSSIKNLSSPTLFDELTAQSRQFIATRHSQGLLCGQTMGDELKYMGTANVVRDMDFMSKVFGGAAAKINFWGGSYGSILGAYLVNMLPDRIGYAVIDGIADPVSWSNEPSHKWPANWLYSAEATYQMYLEDCSKAGPTLCPLTKFRGEPYKDIMDRFEQFFESLAAEPLPTPFSIRPSYLTSGAARGILLMTLERPVNWPSSAVAFAEAMSGNATLLSNTILARRGGGSVTRLAVSCADSPPTSFPPTAEDLAEEQLKTMQEVSPHFGANTALNEPDGGCAYWPTSGRGPERFTGPWNASLEVPLLIISNTHDPITPISSGMRINSLMPNSSILLIQEGPGHCSLAMQSLCTARKLKEYFAGIIPKNGTRCGVDNLTFPGSEDEETLITTAMSEDERRMMEAWKKMEGVLARARGW